MSRFLPAIIAVAIATLGTFLWGVPKHFGAHPFWADRVLFVGAPIGLILGLTLIRLHYVASVLALLVLTLLSYATAHSAKTQFAASYAEDAFAGQMWYFGWYAVCISAAALIARAAIRKN